MPTFTNLGTSFPLFHVRDTVLHSEDYQTRPTCLHLTKVVCLGNLSRHFYVWHCCTSLYWHQPRCTSLFYAAPHAALFRAASCGYVIWDVWCVCCVAVTCWVVPVTNSWWALMINDKFSVAKLKMHLVLVFECLPKIMICMREIKVFEFTDSHLFTYLLLFYHLSTFTEQLFLSIVRRCFSHFCRFHFSDQVTKLKK